MSDTSKQGEPGRGVVKSEQNSNANDHRQRPGQSGSAGDNDNPRKNCCEIADNAIKRRWRAFCKCMKVAANPVTAVGAVAAVIVAIIALSETRNMLKQIERAWIAPGSIRLGAPLETGKFNEVFLNYRNPGKQPATNMIYRIEPIALARNDIDKTGVIEARILQAMNGIQCTSREPSADGAVVYPSGEGNEGIRVGITKELVAKVQNKKNYLLIAGCFAYETFGETHHSAFCRFFDFGVLKPDATSMDWSPSKCFAPDYAD